MPRILREIVERAVTAEPDMEIVPGPPPGATLEAAVEASDADFVISGASSENGEFGHLLADRPGLRLLSVTRDGREAFLHELRPTSTPLGDISPQTIVDAIRSRRPAR